MLTGGGADILAGKLVFDYTSGSPLTTIQTAVGLNKIYEPAGLPPLICIDNLAGKVTVQSTLLGDANVDGSVDGTDLNRVLSNYNLTGMDLGPGRFQLRRNGRWHGPQHGAVELQPGRRGAAAVPEPSTLLLAAMAWPDCWLMAGGSGSKRACWTLDSGWWM